MRLSLLTQDTPILPPDVFEAVVNGLAHALVREYRERHAIANVERLQSPPPPLPSALPPTWLTVREAAYRARCSEGTIRREVRAERLRVVKVGGRRSLRFRSEWIDAWLEAGANEARQPRASKGRSSKATR